MKRFFTTDRSVKMCIICVGLALLLLVHFRSRHPRGPNFCPIDGQKAQWTQQSSAGQCEYMHYSDMERNAHHWSGACP
jgi:hypothetical protein